MLLILLIQYLSCELLKICSLNTLTKTEVYVLTSFAILWDFRLLRIRRTKLIIVLCSVLNLMELSGLLQCPRTQTWKHGTGDSGDLKAKFANL